MTFLDIVHCASFPDTSPNFFPPQSSTGFSFGNDFCRLRAFHGFHHQRGLPLPRHWNIEISPTQQGVRGDLARRSLGGTAFANGRKHDFRLFKESKTRIRPGIRSVADSGYAGIDQLHPNAALPKKHSKKHPLTGLDKAANRALSSFRVLNENVIGSLKRFKLIADKYRNRRKRFALRFNIIAGIYNFELPCN